MRTDIDTIVSRVEAEGVCVVPDFIPRDLLAQIKDTVDRLNTAERDSGCGFIESEGANQRVFKLVNKGELFEQIVQHEDDSSMVLPPRCARWHIRSTNRACCRSDNTGVAI